jgi:hypothetical protein
MSRYDEVALSKIESVLEKSGKMYTNVTRAYVMKMHGVEYLLFHHGVNGKQNPSSVEADNVCEVTSR